MIRYCVRSASPVASDISRACFTLQRSALDPTQVRLCGSCGGKSGIGAGIPRVLRFSQTILIPSTAPHSHYQCYIVSILATSLNKHPTIRLMLRRSHLPLCGVPQHVLWLTGAPRLLLTVYLMHMRSHFTLCGVCQFRR
jgi:hypothetical protein